MTTTEDPNMRTFTIRARGPLALFCPAWLRAEPYTEPVITPSAAAGLYRSLYRKPQFEWVVERIRVLSPIRYETMKRSGVQKDAFTKGYGRGLAEPPRDPGFLQQIQTVLRDVDYVLDAHVHLNEDAMHPQRVRTLHEVERIVEHYFDRGSVFGLPCGGRTEFPLDVEYLPDGYDGPTIPDDLDLGPMLLGMSPVDSAKNQWRPVYVRLRMVQGVVTVPQAPYGPLLRALNADAARLARAGAFKGLIDAPADVL